MLKIRSLENIGLNLKTTTQNNTRPPFKTRGKSKRAVLQHRVFGCDHSFFQWLIFTARYIQKRYRLRRAWFMDIFVMILGALIMGVIIGQKPIHDRYFVLVLVGVVFFSGCFFFGLLSCFLINSFCFCFIVFPRHR